MTEHPHPDDRDRTEAREAPDVPESSESPESPESSEAPGTDTTTANRDTSVYVRRGRTPTLAFWVLLALVVPTAVGLAAAPFLGFGDLSGMVNFALVVLVVIGLPLAALATLVDLLQDRRRRRRTTR